VSSVTAGVRRIVRRNMSPELSPFDPTQFAPHDPDDAQVVGQLFGVSVTRDEEVDMPGAVVTEYGVFGPVERVG
jgi:hypothetical protein